MSLNEALKGKRFSNYYTNITGYEKVDKVGKYYYIFEKQNGNYLVYKAYDRKLSQKIYLFSTTDINSVIYLGDYIYFKKGNIFYYWSINGVRKVLENTELEFNDDITLGVYIK